MEWRIVTVKCEEKNNFEENAPPQLGGCVRRSHRLPFQYKRVAEAAICTLLNECKSFTLFKRQCKTH